MSESMIYISRDAEPYSGYYQLYARKPKATGEEWSSRGGRMQVLPADDFENLFNFSLNPGEMCRASFVVGRESEIERLEQ